MALTREDLAAMNVPEEAAGQILAALAGAEEALEARNREAEAEREALTQEVRGLTGERDELAGHVARLTREAGEAEEAQTRRIREEALAQALRRRGANEEALPLLLAAQKEDGAEDAEEAAERIRATWPAMFARTVRIPVPGASPPVRRLDGRITAREVRAMSAEEINRNWSAIRMALTKGEMN